jgi:hypothetical protein
MDVLSDVYGTVMMMDIPLHSSLLPNEQAEEEERGFFWL